MKHMHYNSVYSLIKKVLGFELQIPTAKQNTGNSSEIVAWEKLLIANKIETKFGITINDECLEKANSVEEIIRMVLSLNQENKTFINY